MFHIQILVNITDNVCMPGLLQPGYFKKTTIIYLPHQHPPCFGKAIIAEFEIIYSRLQ
jgi:hypothetical protein